MDSKSHIKKLSLAHRVTIVVLSVLGTAVSGYATYHHLLWKKLGKTEAFCNINQQISCDVVAASDYSEVMGIPVAVFGLALFFGLTVLSLVWEKLRISISSFILLYLVNVVAACAASVFLGSISVFIIGAVCPSCMATYVVSVAMAIHVFLLRHYIDMNEGQDFMKSTSIQAGASILILVVFLIYTGNSSQAVAPAQNVQKTPAKLSSPPELKREIPLSKSQYAGLGEDYRKGNEQAKVVLVEFADFECPACAMMAKVLSEVYQNQKDKILVAFKNYPLDSKCNKDIKVHKHACEAATLARCAGKFGKFWEVHDKFFEKQRELTPGNMRLWVEQVGVPKSEIENCLKSPDIAAKIKDDIELGDRLGLGGTPTLYINGIEYNGNRDAASISRYIDVVLSGL